MKFSVHVPYLLPSKQIASFGAVTYGRTDEYDEAGRCYPISMMDIKCRDYDICSHIGREDEFSWSLWFLKTPQKCAAS
jgi:hypothetical protein